MEAPDGLEILGFVDAAQWEAWLADHHALRPGVWLKIAKKNSGHASVTPSEALDVCLCYGWIDSQRKAFDEVCFVQKYSPRRPNGTWSKVNVDRVAALVAAGRMRPPGLAEVAAAKADGRWDAAYESQEKATIPTDLVAALGRNKQAKTFYETLGRTDQYAVMLRLMKARTPAVRAARLQGLIALLEAGKKAN